MLLSESCFPKNPLRDAITKAYRVKEKTCVEHLLANTSLTDEQNRVAYDLAKAWVTTIRSQQSEQSSVEALMHRYDLSCEEGVLLMCLAEALLRIPDTDTENLLIRDKLGAGQWARDDEDSAGGLGQLATWGLSFTGSLFGQRDNGNYFSGLWRGMLARCGEPVIRTALREVMKQFSHQFVVGETIENAIQASSPMIAFGYTYSYDMLGEVAMTQHDADRYFDAYTHAIDAIQGSVDSQHDIMDRPGISIKLSALFPRYEFSQQERAVPFLVKRLKTLAIQAKNAGIGLNVDAEEADRLDISLDIFEKVYVDADLEGWEGFGLAVQAYQKRAFYVIEWLIDLAKQHGRRIPVRLVKGAYWDTEIKLSQVEGFVDYPVFTRKLNTDVSYLACAKKMLGAAGLIYSQFATHNAMSAACILAMMEDPTAYEFEFQNLQGMGRSLHDLLIKQYEGKVRSRIYAPVGEYSDLLPYLVRRLLENGANSSFINKIYDKNTSIDTLVQNPLKEAAELKTVANANIPLPRQIYAKLPDPSQKRKNSAGLDVSDYDELKPLQESLKQAAQIEWIAKPQLQNKADPHDAVPVLSPYNQTLKVGECLMGTKPDVEMALSDAQSAFKTWSRVDVNDRAVMLENVAKRLEENSAELMYLAIHEAGKTLHDAINEIREAVDFCYYYAAQARVHLAPQSLPGPTGETNQLVMHGRGTVLCISPWNFPIAIFTGQVMAAIAAGNCVIAKPAEQTCLCAYRVVELMHEAGIPRAVLQCLPGKGEDVGAALVEDARINAVMFTGSNETAALIQKTLANRSGSIIPLIAETGGINALIADSSALPEQLVADVVQSAFGSAGQRCSALRVLFVQDDIADRVIEMLKGAMAELKLGNPEQLATDVGPVIDKEAQSRLLEHQARMQTEAQLIYAVDVTDDLNDGFYVAPQAYELSELSLLNQEVFGPILHVLRYDKKSLDDVIDQVNNLGFGLTFGVHSRITSQVQHIVDRIEAGNVYVNRNIIGAVVGVQPFGGCKLSGTGPKAGGPHYLYRLSDEKTVTVNTTAVGGNASLMSL